MSERHPSGSFSDVLYGVAAYSLWGLIPLYFKVVAQVSPVEVLAHRVLWSFVVLAVLASLLGRWGDVWKDLRNRKIVLLLGLNSLLMAANWLTFIYSVLTDQVLQSSLGYFIGPLIIVLLGALFLRERLRPAQRVSLGMAVVGVLVFTVAMGAMPGIALILALTGAFHGLIRKLTPVDGFVSLTIETLLIVPLSVVFLSYLAVTAKNSGNSAALLGLLMLSGPVTTVPFLCFGRAVRRLRLSTMGFLQYLLPSLQFLLAVAVFHESFSTAQLVSFACIWTAIGIYTVDSYRAIRQGQLPPIEPLAIDP